MQLIPKETSRGGAVSLRRLASSMSGATLEECAEGETVVVRRVHDRDPEELDYLDDVDANRQPDSGPVEHP